MFTKNFEKKASISESLKAVGKSSVEGAKGVGHGLKYLAKRTSEKITSEVPKLKSGWKGFKDPSSYKAVGEFATKMAPEAAVAGAGLYVANKALNPNNRDKATLAYY